jgi:hypothetical protein
MSNENKKTMLAAYIEQASLPMFLQGLFQSPRGNYFNSESVEVDVVRSGEDLAIVVQDPSTGYRMNSLDRYTNKEFKPPAFKEAVAINAWDLLQRMAGSNPFQNDEFRSKLIAKIFAAAAKIEAKVRRSVELQAAQIMTTGTVTLIDENGTALYTLDFQPKASHLVADITAWDAEGATILENLAATAGVVRADGKIDPDQLLFGNDSWEAFIKNEAVRARFDARRIDLGTISPMQIRGGGGQYRGVVEIDNYRFDCWTYNGMYTHPQSGNATLYIPGDKVIVRASSGRLDACFGAVPNVAQLLGVQNVVNLPELPGRLANTQGGMDLFVRTWLSPDGDQFFAGFGSRPLLIPTAIDTIACITTGVPSASED